MKTLTVCTLNVTGAKFIFTVPEFLSKAQSTGLPVGLIEGDAACSESNNKPFLHYSDLLKSDPNNTPRLGLLNTFFHFFN